MMRKVTYEGVSKMESLETIAVLQLRELKKMKGREKPVPYALRLANYGVVMMALARLPESLKAIEEADAIRTSIRSTMDGDRRSIATLKWLLGRREEAISTMLSTTDAILRGDIIYTDAAGGVLSGALLRYFGLASGDTSAATAAITFLKENKNRKGVNVWPSAIKDLLLENGTFTQVVKQATNASTFDLAKMGALDSPLKSRQLCEAIFYQAVACRSIGDEENTIKWMQECCALPNPQLVEEWYLASAECAEGKQRNRPAAP
jgi:hypothetical protein